MPLQGTFGTMRQAILEGIGKTRDIDSNLVSLEIVNAIQHYRTVPFWFNQGRAHFDMVAGTSQYETNAQSTARNALTGPPFDVVRVLHMEARDPDDLAYRWPVQEQTFDFVAADLERAVNAQPCYWTWILDTSTSQTERDPSMLFSPPPDKAYEIWLNFVQDIGTPNAKYDGAAWVFYDPATPTAPISNTYTNPWFTYAYELIEARALRNIYSKYIKNEARAVFYGQLEQEAKAGLMDWSAGRKRPPIIPSWGV